MAEAEGLEVQSWDSYPAALLNDPHSSAHIREKMRCELKQSRKKLKKELWSAHLSSPHLDVRGESEEHEEEGNKRANCLAPTDSERECEKLMIL